MSLTEIRLALASFFSRDSVNSRIYPTSYTTDSFIVGSNQFDDAGGTDRDSRMFFNKTKSAFRAGQVTSTSWNDASVGLNSAAFGLDTRASGAQSFAAGQSIASGTGATAFGASIASSTQAFAVGAGTASTNTNAFAAGSSTATGSHSVALGEGTRADGFASVSSGAFSSAPRYGQEALAGYFFVAEGDRQTNRFSAGRISTSATPVVLFFDSVTSATLTGQNTNVLTIPVNKVHRFEIRAAARRTDVTGDAAGFTITGTIVRASAGSAAFISAPVVVTDATAGAATWTLVATINTTDATNNYLQITATGEAAKTIRWVASIETTEVG